MVASSSAVGAGRSRSADLDEAQPEPVVETPVTRPVAENYNPASPARAYAPQGYSTASAEAVRTISPSAPVAASLVSTVSSAGVAVAAPLPPSRPFELGGSPRGGRPLLVPAATRAALPQGRASVASLFAAPERAPAQRFSSSHPLNRSLVAQPLQPLSRN